MIKISKKSTHKKWVLILFFCSIMILLFISFTNYKKSNPLPPNSLKGLDSEIMAIIKQWNVSGISVGIISKDGVLYSKGFGYRNLEKQLPVTSQTLFPIGSCTKAFTASLIGILEDQGKLKFNDSPRKYIPTLNFFNEEMNEKITLENIMFHGTGLDRHDETWYLFKADSREKILQKIPYLPPAAKVAEKWIYNNLQYMILGLVAEGITDRTYEHQIKKSLLNPLDMKASNFSIRELQKNKNAALGYTLNNSDQIKRMNYVDLTSIAPAGGLNSNVEDLSKWMQIWLNEGSYKHKKILPPTFLKKASSGHFSTDMGSSYGYGWYVSSYKDHKRVEHGGNIDGFTAHLAFYPVDKKAIIILSNQKNSFVPYMLTNIISDRILNLERTDWNQIKRKEYERNKSIRINNKITFPKEKIKPNTTPSHPLTDYEGRYVNQGYGSFDLQLQNDSLIVDLSGRKINLKHLHYDVFKGIEIKYKHTDSTELLQIPFNFQTSFSGDISGVEIQDFNLTTNPPLYFYKTKPSIHLGIKELEKFVGNYEIDGMVSRVFLKNGNLFIQVPGQKQDQFSPIAMNKFTSKNFIDWEFEFTENEKGVIDAIILTAPHGTFKSKKLK